jgi:tRNA1(Val) A37 N6-methylase TrmN6
MSTHAPQDWQVQEAREREQRVRSSWLAPGPRPAGDRFDQAWAPGRGETLDRLCGDWCLYQLRDGHRFSMDDQLTADYGAQLALERGLAVDRLLDLGCGLGTVGLMLAWRFPHASLLGVEAQAASVALARRSLAFNGVTGRARVEHADLRSFPLEPVHHLVTGTPPYLPYGTGTVSARPQCDPCRFEARGGVEQYVEAGARGLAPGGLMALCMDARHPQRVLRAAGECGLQVARLRPVVGREGKPPLFTLFALQWLADAPGPTREDPPFVIRSADGARSPEYRALRVRTGFPP